MRHTRFVEKVDRFCRETSIVGGFFEGDAVNALSKSRKGNRYEPGAFGWTIHQRYVD